MPARYEARKRRDGLPPLEAWHDQQVTLADLRTPAVLVDKARVLRNIDRMQAAAEARGIRLRPHAKTHKSPVIARWQIDRGAVGICCAKLGEAEVFANAGIKDIRLPYPLNPSNADRLIALAARTHVSFIVDHIGVANAWSRGAGGGGRHDRRPGEGGCGLPPVRDRSRPGNRSAVHAAHRGAARPSAARAAFPRGAVVSRRLRGCTFRRWRPRKHTRSRRWRPPRARPA